MNMDDLIELDKGNGVICDFCFSNRNSFIEYLKYDASLSISKKNTRGFYKCNSCGLHFTFPKPTPTDLKRFYCSEYQDRRFNKPLQSLLRLIFW